MPGQPDQPAFFDQLLRDVPPVASVRLAACRYTLNLRFGTCAVRLCTDAPELVPILQQLYAALEHRSPEHHITYHCWREAERWQVARQGKLAAQETGLDNLLPRLDWLLTSELVDAHRQLPLLHAAGLQRGASTLVLVGPSGSGKSSLCYLLGTQQWRIISDEVIALGTDEISGISRAICVGTHLVNHGAPAAKHGRRYHYSDCNALCYTRVAPPATHVVLLDKAEQATQLTELSGVTAVQALLGNMFETSTNCRAKLEQLLLLAETATLLRLQWHDLALAHACLAEMGKAYGTQDADSAT